MSTPLPPWSKKKRLRTTAVMTGVVAGISVALGTVVFLFSTLTGVIRPFSLHKSVENEVLKNPNLVSAFHENLSLTECDNTKQKFKVLFEHPLVASIGNENNKCTEFKLINAASTTSYIKIEQNDESKEQKIDSLISELETVESNMFNHPTYEATLVSGYSNSLFINAIVMATSNQNSVTLLLYPADAAGINALKQLAATYQLL